MRWGFTERAREDARARRTLHQLVDGLVAQADHAGDVLPIRLVVRQGALAPTIGIGAGTLAGLAFGVLPPAIAAVTVVAILVPVGHLVSGAAER